MGPTTGVRAFATCELVDGVALPHFEGNEEAASKEGCNSSDFVVSRPWGYVVPGQWLTSLPFSFTPVDSTTGYSWENITRQNKTHPFIISVLFLGR